MKNKDMLCNPFCNPAMLEDLKKTRVTEIASEVWMIEGYAGTTFLLEPPSGNIFIMRDGDMVLLMDTGHHGFYRELIIDILKKFRKAGAHKLFLTLSHGHWDHGKNNDVIDEAGYEEVHFLLPEPELQVIDIPSHMIGDTEKAAYYFDPGVIMPEGFRAFLGWVKNFPEFNDPRYRSTWDLIEALPADYDPEKTKAVWASILTNVLCPDLSSYLIGRVEPLALSARERRTYGSVELLGWPMGRFFAIHDATQSPGHLSIYDPKNKLMISGDATLEINPPFMDCNFGNCIDFCRKLSRMAEESHIASATDCHRTSQWWPRFFSTWGLEPLAPIQLVDVARGKEECLAFYKLWVDYFTTLREETLLAHSRIGEATVEEIVTELGHSDNKFVRFKLGLRMPQIPSRPEVLVAKVLAEAEAPRRIEGGRILFKPIEKWNFTNSRQE